MIERVSTQPPRLSSMQRLWLLELGLDRPMLARLTPGSTESAAQGSSQPGTKNKASPEDASRASSALAALRQPRREGARAPDAQTGRPRTSSDNLVSIAAVLKRGGETVPAQDQTKNVPRDPERTDEAASGWPMLKARIETCESCALHAGRHRAVPGAGATESVEWLVVGEAPGDRDDRLGEPFQGKAGELLHAMLSAAGIDPQGAVFYTNLIKCRPRSNRPPSPEEIAACLPYLHSQIELLEPRRILVLGRLAAQALLADGLPFEEQRGRIHAFHAKSGVAIPMVVTYHPASLLSQPRHKAASWRDLNLARSGA